jgi:glycosyltransferase involved in cell wall biosynthesis
MNNKQQDQEITFSIIVPAYNVEKYIARCLDSLLAQKYPAAEILVIDDGATDGTVDVVNSYAGKCPAIRLIRQENVGLGATRNVGIREAVGDYLVFVDSDDYIDAGLTADCRAALEKKPYDLLYFNFEWIPSDPGYGPSEGRWPPLLVGKSALEGAEKDRIFNNDAYRVCTTVCRRQFLLDNDIKNGEGYFFEDAEFFFKAVLLAGSIKLLRKPYYKYYIRPDSIIENPDEAFVDKRLEGRERSMQAVLAILREYKASDFAVASYFNHEHADCSDFYRQVERYAYRYRMRYLASTYGAMAGFSFDDAGAEALDEDLREWFGDGTVEKRDFARIADGILSKRVRMSDGEIRARDEEIASLRKVAEESWRKREDLQRQLNAVGLAGDAFRREGERLSAELAEIQNSRAYRLVRKLSRVKGGGGKQAPLISVIVPVYNTEAYLRLCMDSILGQTMQDIEVICVNDGSTDGSPDILREYAARDGRVRVIDQPNGGAGVARNTGLDAAQGRYFSFLDADDFYDPDMLRLAYEECEAKHADYCVYDYDFFEDDPQDRYTTDWSIKKECLPEQRPFGKDDLGGNLFNVFTNVPWNKLFSAEFVRRAGLRFQEIANTNDRLFAISALFQAERITVLPQVLAHYRTRSGQSLTDSKGRDWGCLTEAFVEERAMLQRLGLYERYEQPFLENLREYLAWQLERMQEAGCAEKQEAFAREWAELFGIAL